MIYLKVQESTTLEDLENLLKMMFQMNLVLFGLNAAEELSYLNNESQKLVYSAIKYYECTSSIMRSR